MKNLTDLGLSLYALEQDSATGNKSTIIYYESIDSSIDKYDCFQLSKIIARIKSN